MESRYFSHEQIEYIIRNIVADHVFVRVDVLRYDFYRRDRRYVIDVVIGLYAQARVSVPNNITYLFMRDQMV